MYFYDIEFHDAARGYRPACEYREGFKTLKAAKAAATRAAKNIGFTRGDLIRVKAGEASPFEGLVILASKAGYSENWNTREW